MAIEELTKEKLEELAVYANKCNVRSESCILSPHKLGELVKLAQRAHLEQPANAPVTDEMVIEELGKHAAAVDMLKCLGYFWNGKIPAWILTQPPELPKEAPAVVDGEKALMNAVKQVRAHERSIGRVVIGGDPSEVGMSFRVQQLGFAIDSLEHAANLCARKAVAAQAVPYPVGFLAVESPAYLTREVFSLAVSHPRLPKGVYSVYLAPPAAPAGEADAKRLDLFEKNGRLSMELRYPDPEEAGVWTVLEESGGWNDREWTVVGAGATVRVAIDAAMAKEKP